MTTPSRAKLRAEVVPSPPEPEADPLQLQADLPRCLDQHADAELAGGVPPQHHSSPGE